MRSHVRRDTARPTRREINAAFKAYDVLYAPLPLIGKETDMPKANVTETATATDIPREGELMRAQPQSVESVAGSHESMSLANLSEAAIAEAIEAIRELQISFTAFTPAEKLAAMNLSLFITDIVTIRIKAKANDKDRDADGMKPVHVFKLETGDGIEYAAMFGLNPWRDRVATGFTKAAIAGIGVRVGPVRIEKKDTGNMQPAWIFAPQTGFRTEQRLNGARGF